MNPSTDQNKKDKLSSRFKLAWTHLSISDRVFAILSITLVLCFFAIIGIWIEGWDIKLVLFAASTLVIYDIVSTIANKDQG